jgi:hypothetical protein
MANNRSLYHSYLLRLWSADEQEQVVWRASLENPHTGERLAFASLERLFGFLQDQTMNLSGDETQRPSSPK